MVSPELGFEFVKLKEGFGQNGEDFWFFQMLNNQVKSEN